MMSKKKIFAIAGVGVFVLVLGILVFGKTQKQESLVSPLFKEGPPAETEAGKLLFYEDEAGFSFKYLATLGIVEKDINDPSVYSSLELSSKIYPQEKLIIKITDTSFTTPDEWREKNPQEGSLGGKEEVSLATMKGQKLKYKDPPKSLILVIDSGILYYFGAPSDNRFWDESLNIIISSFALTDSQTRAGSSGVSLIEEEEEIIE